MQAHELMPGMVINYLGREETITHVNPYDYDPKNSICIETTHFHLLTSTHTEFEVVSGFEQLDLFESLDSINKQIQFN